MNQRAPTLPPPETARHNQRQAILDLLSDGKLHSTAALIAVSSHRFSARVAELRNAGWVIEKETFDGREYFWKLTGRGQLRLW